MFKSILLPVDNSRYSDFSLELAISLAQRLGSTIAGFHVYAARLHEGRFQQLETSLPPKYQQPGVMEKQRQVHTSLILQGLELISHSYLEGCAARCHQRGVTFEEKLAEGKNYAEIVKEAENSYDLVVLGAKGLGEEEEQLVGSVCLRTVRRLVKVNTLIIKEKSPLGGLFIVALDGSYWSRRGYRLALFLAKAFGGKVEAIAVYDPEFHTRVFQNLVGVLSHEAGKLFHFQEQERLHQEVIDQGMGKLCQEYLDWAQGMAKEMGVPFGGEVLQGKAATAIARYTREHRPCLLVAGRFGSHHTDEADLGSTVEALLWSSPSNLLIVADGMRWSQEALTKLEQVPQGVTRELTRQRVEEMAKHRGESLVTQELVETKYTQWAQGSARAESELPWSSEARKRMERVPSFIRGMVVKSIEGYARRKGAAEITPELVEEAKAYWEQTGTFHL